MGVEAFASTADFLQALTQYTPDCLLLDVYMPGLNAYELQAHLARLGLRLPTIIISGSEAGADLAQKCGAVAFLRKPFHIEELLSVLQGVVENRGRIPLSPPAHGPLSSAREVQRRRPSKLAWRSPFASKLGLHLRLFRQPAGIGADCRQEG